MKVLLIYPPDSPAALKRPRKSHLLGLLYIAASARAHGHQVRLLDLQDWGPLVWTGPPHLADGVEFDAARFRPVIAGADLVGISIPFSHLAQVGHQLAQTIKRLRPEIPLVLGGPYVTCQPEMAVCSGADYLVLGEGDAAFVELLDCLSNGQAPEDRPGICACHRPNPAVGLKPAHVADLDALPVLARDLIPYHNYVLRSQRNISDVHTASILTSRGCPYDCDFCAIHSVFGHTWRGRNAESVLDEVDQLTECYQIGNLEIEDDNFTLDPARATAILEGLIRRQEKRQLSWTAPNGLRIDTLDREMIQLFARSGCRHVFLALEHGDRDMLNLVIGKQLSLEKVREVMADLGRYGIACYLFVLYGYPGESPQSFENALEYYRALKRIYAGLEYAFLLPEPYPKTRLWRRAIQQGWIPATAFQSSQAMSAYYFRPGPWITTPELSADKILRRGRALRQEFPSRQTYVEGVDPQPPPSVSTDGMRSGSPV